MGNINKNSRLIRVISASVIMIAIGFIYGWSIFSEPISDEFQWSPTELNFTFTVLMWMFVAGGIIGARISELLSSKVALIIGALLIFFSFFLTTTLVKQNTPWILYLTYGVLGGGGVGICYTVTLSAAVSWFPERTGTITGILLLCYSFSTMLLGYVASNLFALMEWRMAFIGLSAVISVVIILMSFIVRQPNNNERLAFNSSKINISLQQKDLPSKDGYSQEKDNLNNLPLNKDFKTKEMMRTPAFWFYAVWMLAVSTIGLGLIGTNNNIALECGLSATLSVTAVGIFSICNGLGRLINGLIYDVLGAIRTMFIVAIIHTLGCLFIMLSLITGSEILLLVSFIITPIGIGGTSIVGSGFISNIYGSKYYAKNLSVLNTSLIPAAFFGPLIMSASAKYSVTYSYGLISLAIVGFIALFSVFITRIAINKIKR